MKTFLLALLAVTVLMVVYALWVRPWIRRQPWAEDFFAKVDFIELRLWKKSETILFARLKMAVGLILTLLTQAGEIDVTPILPLVPEEWQGVVTFAVKSLPLLITFVGYVDQQLRYDTTKPIELVAVPEAVKSDPVVAEVLATAEATKADAVAVAEAVKQAA